MINFTPFPELTTERLLLRQFKLNDGADILFLRSDEEVNRYVKRPLTANIGEAEAFIHKINTGIQNNQWINWAITLKGKPELIGTICIWNISDDQKTGEVGYDLKPAFHKKGIMNEALQTVLNYGFSIGLKRIEAYTQWDNAASVQLLQHNNFRKDPAKKDENNPDNVVFVLI